MLTTGAHAGWDSKPGSRGCEPNALPLTYPIPIHSVFPLQLSICHYSDIALEVFLTFNKMKGMGVTVETLANALAASSMLQLSEDKLNVRRVTPIAEPKDMDARTVYIVSHRHSIFLP